jgi:hypothetical protein
LSFVKMTIVFDANPRLSSARRMSPTPRSARSMIFTYCARVFVEESNGTKCRP